MPSYGDNEKTTFGEMEGGERHVSGPAGICICDPADVEERHDDYFQEPDPECPMHGSGPSTAEGAVRVRDAIIAQTEASGIPPAGTGIIRTGADGATSAPGLPPLGESTRVDDPPIDVGPEAPSIADFPIDESTQADRQGSTYRILEGQIMPMVRAAVMQHSMGERIGWEVSPLPMPDQQGNMTLGWMFFISIPGMVLNTCINNSIAFNNLIGWQQDMISQMVSEVIEAAKKQRSGQVAQMEQMQAQSRAAGNGQGPSGLILPGM